MGIVGLTFYGPHGVIYYWKINPWFMEVFFPKYLLVSFLKHYAKWKRVVLSAFFDTFIYNLPYFSFGLFWAGIIKHYGSVSKAIDDVKR